MIIQNFKNAGDPSEVATDPKLSERTELKAEIDHYGSAARFTTPGQCV
jgi:hypothetical protein